MDYKKTLCFYEENGKDVMCKFDIVLNRAIALKGLKEFPNIADVMFGKKKLAKTDNENILQDLEVEDIEALFAINDEIPEMLAYIFPQMLDKGTIEVGERDSIIELVNDLVYDDDFAKAMTDFFMVAFSQKEKQATRKVKFSMK